MSKHVIFYNNNTKLSNVALELVLQSNNCIIFTTIDNYETKVIFLSPEISNVAVVVKYLQKKTEERLSTFRIIFFNKICHVKIKKRASIKWYLNVYFTAV